MRTSNGIAVYIAMAYTDDPERWTAEAIRMWNELYELGYEPYCPHLMHFVEQRFPKDYHAWMGHVKFWMHRSDVMLRLNVAPSPGADVEESSFQGPTFHTVEELEEWKEKQIARTQYVVGLVFDEYMEDIALIEKKRGPKCVIDRWNGLGGKIESGETPKQAMVREFEEESGVFIQADEWRSLGVLETNEYVLHFLTAKSDDIYECDSLEDEEVIVHDINQLPPNTMPNIRWMIPFALDRDVDEWGKIPLVRH